MHHADRSDQKRHRCFSLVAVNDGAARIDQKSFAGYFVRFGENWPALVCPAVLADGVVSETPC